MIKKIFSLILTNLIFFCCYFNSYGFELSVSAQSAVLLCVNSGEIIFSKNENKRLSMASTTKIMTSLLALEAATPQREITVTKEMVSVEGTSMGLVAGDRVSLIELVYGMMLQSGNDAANTVAYVLGGNPDRFSEMMNNRAFQIGMKNTNFVTASGLDDDNHYSTAYDMALLASECIKHPEFRHISSQKTVRLSYGNPPYFRTLTNHNRLLWKYADAIGIKTGFTKKSGRCLVSAAERDGITLVAVTLNASDDWNDHISMFEYGFSKCKPIKSNLDISSVSLKIVGGEKNNIPVKLSREYVYLEGKSVSYSLIIKPFEYAPVKVGQTVGYAVFSSDGKIVDEIPVITDGKATLKEYLQPEEKIKENTFQFLIKKFKELLNNTPLSGVQR